MPIYTQRLCSFPSNVENAATLFYNARHSTYHNDRPPVCCRWKPAHRPLANLCSHCRRAIVAPDGDGNMIPFIVYIVNDFPVIRARLIEWFSQRLHGGGAIGGEHLFHRRQRIGDGRCIAAKTGKNKPVPDFVFGFYQDSLLFPSP